MPRAISLRQGSFVNNRDLLVIGEYEPDASTTGVVAGTSLSSQNGDITLSTPGQTYEGWDVSGRIIVTAANVTIRNCVVRGVNSAPSGDQFLITATSASVTNLVIEDCEIVPQYPHWNWDSGITGHDFTARRCNIHHVTDGINVYNTTAAQPYDTNVVIEGCYIHDMGWWTASSVGVVHPSDTETHNDGIQHQGGYGTIIRGNRIDAFYARQYGHWRATNLPTEPYTFIALNSISEGSAADGGPYRSTPDRGDGTLATGRYNYESCAAIMVNHNVGNSYLFTITDNWLRGGQQCLNSGGAGYIAAGFGDVLRNKFDHSQGFQGAGGDNTQTIALDATWNGTGAYNFGIGTGDANIYEDNGHEVTVRLNQ